MQKTKIEFVDYTINPIKGICKGGCNYCYAKKLYDRFKWNPAIRFDKEELHWKLIKIAQTNKSSRIFIGSTHDIMGTWIPDEWIQIIIDKCNYYPQHTFLFLTKNPERYKNFRFPFNCWLGTTITDFEDRDRIWQLVHHKQKSNLCFVSYEPILTNIHTDYLMMADWIILGLLTQNKKCIPEQKYINGLVNLLQIANIPVFMKNSIKKCWDGELIQQIPKRGISVSMRE